MHRVITFTIGLVAFVIPSLAAADTVRRFDGLWANEAHGCRLYMSKKLENDDRLDMSTRRSFGLTEIRDGNIQLIYQKVSCLITKATPINSSDVALIAACDMRKSQPRDGSGTLFRRKPVADPTRQGLPELRRRALLAVSGCL